MQAPSEPLTTVLLVRHGETTWNAEGRWQGHEDAPLSPLGEVQAREAAARLPAIDAVWASDLQRARHTAEIIATTRGIPVHVEARFRERHGGPWQGLTRAEIDARWPGFLMDGRRPDGYETSESGATRAFAALEELAASHAGKTVLVVTHGGIVRAVERHLGDTTRREVAGAIPNLGGRCIVHDGVAWQLGDPIAPLQAGFLTASPEA